MQLKSLKIYFQNALLGYYPDTEIQSFYRILGEFYLAYKPVDLVVKGEEPIKEKHFNFFQEAIERLQKYEPVQYILGQTTFYGLIIKVNESVLIPRPETEELVDWIINDYKGKNLRILDIGTGSGCIPIAVSSHLKKSEVTALDISMQALDLARKNAKINDVNVDFIETDILSIKLDEFIATNGTFDIIVSNPPYVKPSEKGLMKENVLNYEPHIALFVEEDDALIFYKKIIALSNKLLNAGGALYFEINEGMGAEMEDIMKPKFKDINLRKDISGKDRMIKGIKI